jgi:hypothetical protein
MPAIPKAFVQLCETPIASCEQHPWAIHPARAGSPTTPARAFSGVFDLYHDYSSVASEYSESIDSIENKIIK